MREVCLNHEVVVFQPWTLTTSNIGSRCLKLHFNLAVNPHLFILSFLDHLFPPHSYRLPTHSCSSSKPSRSTRSPPQLPVQSDDHLGVSLTCHQSASASRHNLWCMLTVLRDQQYDWIMRWWCFNPHPVRAQYLDSSAYWLHPHNLFYSFLDRSFRFSPLFDLSPISSLILPVNATYISLITCFFPLLYRQVVEQPST